MHNILDNYTYAELHKFKTLLTRSIDGGMTINELLVAITNHIDEDIKQRASVIKESEGSTRNFEDYPEDGLCARCGNPLTFFSVDGSDGDGTELEGYTKTSICWSCLDQQYYDELGKVG